VQAKQNSLSNKEYVPFGCMKRVFFKFLAAFNRALLPSFGKKDLTKLSTMQKAIVAYRYWVTTNALD
jgi:hypothetical protein